MSIRGDNFPRAEDARYYKFDFWTSSNVPEVGQLDFQPKNGALRIFSEGSFRATHSLAFPAQKLKTKLPPLGYCAYCLRKTDTLGVALKLTSEHLIPEALGAGLEIDNASCEDCQRMTSAFEGSIIEELFDPVRRHLSLTGKGGLLKKGNFPVDIGIDKIDPVMLPVKHHPTLLVMPKFFPASSYGSRPYNTNGVFNILLHNLNCNSTFLKQYGIDRFSTQLIDTARFCQLIAKIAHIAVTHHFRDYGMSSLVADLIRTNLKPKLRSSTHFNHVGCIWQHDRKVSTNLHEIEVGKIRWNGDNIIAARIQLFSCYQMPSYFVAVAYEQPRTIWSWGTEIR